MSFDAHDLKIAFEDGRVHERERILNLLKEKIVTDPDNANQLNQYKYYEKLFGTRGKIYWKT